MKRTKEHSLSKYWEDLAEKDGLQRRIGYFDWLIAEGCDDLTRPISNLVKEETKKSWNAALRKACKIKGIRNTLEQKKIERLMKK